MKTRAKAPGRKAGLTATLAVAFFTLSTVVLLISSGLQIFSGAQTQQKTIASQQQLITQDAARRVSSFVQEKFTVLETTVRLVAPAAASPEEQVTILQSLLGFEPAFRQLLLLDAQGQTAAWVSRLSRVTSSGSLERVGYESLIRGQEEPRAIGTVYIDELTSEPMVLMSVPVTDILGGFQGTLIAELNLKFMWELMDQLTVGESGQAYVVDRQGNLLAFSDTARVLRGENLRELEEVSEFLASNTLVDESPYGMSTGIKGTTVAASYMPLGSPDWAVVAELPWNEAYQSVIRQAVWSVGITLGMAFLSGLLGVLLARRLAVPLLSLTQTADRIAGGEFDLEATVTGPREVVSLATTFNSMTAQLREFIGGLEQRVAERTGQLEAAAEVARAATSVLDPNELQRQTVDLVRRQFGFYYVGLFLLDPERRFAVLRAGTGEAGRRMMDQQHKLEVGGNSMIGQCTARAEALIASDVGEAAMRFDNPFLPETRSEAALPLRARGQVIGAMTVQSTKEAAFSHADVAVLQTMADQVAVALDNAHLFAESQQALEAERRAYGELSRQAWSELIQARPTLGFLSSDQDLVPIGSLSEPQVQIDADPGAATPGDGDPSVLIFPVKVRGNVIGVVEAHKPDSTQRWTAEESSMMETLTEQLAQALDSARLYQDTQRRAAQEELVGEITSRMRESLDMDRVLQTAVREIGESLGLHDLTIQLEMDADQTE